MNKGRLITGIVLCIVIALFWMFPEALFRGEWGLAALLIPVILAAVTLPLIALAIFFFITAFATPERLGGPKVSPSILALLGAALFVSPFLGIAPPFIAFFLNPTLVIFGLFFIIWGIVGMIKQAPPRF